MQLEAEHKAATIALAKKRQALPWRKIDQDYVFDGGPLGHKSLSDLFGEADTLFVYHLMYSTGKDRACPRCTSLLDQFQSLKLHVQASGLMTFAIIDKGEYETLIPAIESNNWIWDVYSASGNTFAEDIGVTKGGDWRVQKACTITSSRGQVATQARKTCREFRSSSEMLTVKSITPIRCLALHCSNSCSTTSCSI